MPGKSLNESAGIVMEASKSVNQIAQAAEEQQIGMREVGVAMAEIDKGATQLSESARLLTGEVDSITHSQSLLNRALSPG